MTPLEEKLVEYIDDAYAMEQNVLRMLDGSIAAKWNKFVELSLREEGIGTS